MNDFPGLTVRRTDDPFSEKKVENKETLKELMPDKKTKDQQLNKVDKMYIEEMSPPVKIFRDYLKKRIDKMNNPDK